MAAPNFLIMNLLRLITPEEIGDIATKHNGGKFLSLTDLVTERVEHNIYRDFSSVDSMEEIHEQHNPTQAKILPFKRGGEDAEAPTTEGTEEVVSLSSMADAELAEIHSDESLEEQAVEAKEH